LDLLQPVDERVRAELNAALAKYHVLALRDQQLSPPQCQAAQTRRDHAAAGQGRRARISASVRLEAVLVAPGKYLSTAKAFTPIIPGTPSAKGTALHR